MKLVGLHYSHLTVNDRSADKRGLVLILCCHLPPTLPLFPLPQANGRGRRQVAAADTSGLVGPVPNASISQGAGGKQPVIA